MNYEFVDDIKTHKQLKQELIEIIETQTSKKTFDRWMLMGHEDEKYKYSGLIDSEGKLVVAIGLMPTNLYLKGEKYSAIQIGNLFFAKDQTDEDYNLILRKHLLQNIRSKYRHLIDFAYAYKNDLNNQLALELDLVKIEEVNYYLDVSDLSREKTIIKNWELTDHNLRNSLFSMLKHAYRLSESSLDISRDASVRYFNILKYYANNVYYIESYETIVILELKKTKCKIIGVFCKQPINLLDIIKAIVPKQVKEVEFGFNPVNLLKNLEVKKSTNDVYNKAELGTSFLYMKFIDNYMDYDEIKFPLLTRQE